MNEESPNPSRVLLPREPPPWAPAARRNRLAYLGVLGLATALLVGFVAAHLSRQYKATWAQWESRQTSLADDRSRMVSDWLKERQHSAEALASRPLVMAALLPRDAGRLPKGTPVISATALAASLDRFAGPYGYDAIFVVDRQGQVVSQSSLAGEFDAASLAAARQAVEKGEPQVELSGDVPEKCKLSFSAPVFAEERGTNARRAAPKPLGAVTLRIQLAPSLFPLLLSESVPTRTGETVLVRKEGDEVVYISPVRQLKIGTTGLRRPQSVALAGRAALAGKETFGEFLDYRGVRVLAATRRIPATGWGLFRKIDRAEALAEFRRMAWFEALAAVMALAALGGLILAYRRHAESAAINMEQEKFRALLDSAPDAMVIIDRTGRMVLVNSATEALFGYPRSELLGQSLRMLVPERLREERSKFYTRLFDSPVPRVEDRQQERCGLRRDGREFPVEVTLSTVSTLEDRVVAISIRDVTERKQAEQELARLNRSLRTLSECNQATVRGREESELLSNVCRILVQEGGYHLAWVGLAEHDEAKTVRVAAQAGEGADYLAHTSFSWAESDAGRTSTGTAIRTGEVCVARHTEADPASAAWRAEALRCGHAACIALPLISNHQPFGALNLCSSSPEAFDAEELRLLTELAHDLAYGLQALRTRAERARAEAGLERATAYNRSLLEASLDSLVTIAPDGKIMDVNRATEKVTGLSRKELIGTDYSDYFTEPEKARAGYQRVFREGLVQDYALEIHHRDGHTTPALYNASVYRDEAGQVVGVFAAARDITERQRAEEEVRRANAYNRSLLEASLDPLVTIAPDGKITDVNTSTEKATGHSREELIGTDFSDYFTEPEKACASYEQVFREGSVHDYELEIRHRDGRTIPVIYNASVYRDEAGAVTGVFAAARDITDRKHAEKEIHLLNQNLEQRVRERTAEFEAANKELEAFTYSVSHDLRAPLRHVDGFSKLLLESYSAGLPEEARHYVERIRNGARRMGLMVDDLLNLTRVGRRELSLQLTGLNSLLEEVRQELESEVEGRKIEWRFGSLPFVECDPALMRQVFANLLSNALKFTRPRATAVIEVGARDENHSTTVFVRDNGVGFSMKYADKLFGVFQRLHRAEDFEGTGVGLATVQRIVQKHGGRVWAEGELNRGATFFFTLGQRPEQAASPDSKPEVQGAQKGD
ncbi:MAG: PAS domain S-box protein [Acidobacteriia bacterium]|nr:PAS domain S-box protein [Terriglobia bacterium]